MRTKKPQLRPNAAGFFAGGQFHPIRKPKYLLKGGKKITSKEQLELLQDKYNEFDAGDFDTPAERRARKERNLPKSLATLEKQIENQLRRDVYGESDRDSAGKTLMQFVRSLGGIRPHYNKKTGKANDAGELSGLTFKQSKKRGLVSDRSKYTLDGMFQACTEEGYDLRNENDLLDQLDNEIRKGKALYKTHGYIDYRDNPAKNVMTQKKLTEAEIKRTAKTLMQIYPGKSAAQIAKALKSDKSRQTATKTATKKPTTGRAKNPGRRSAAQPSLPGLKKTGDIPAILIREIDLQKPKYANLQREGRNLNDTYYRDQVTGYRYLTRKNPASVKKVKNHYQVLLTNGQYLRDAGEKILKFHSIKQAREVASKTKLSSADEINWLNSLKLQTNPKGKRPVKKAAKKPAAKRNPLNALSALANMGVAGVSALQLHDRLLKQPAKRKPAARRNPAKQQRLKIWTVDLIAPTNERKCVYVKATDRIEAGRDAERQNKGFVFVQIREGKVKNNPQNFKRKTFEMFQGRPATEKQEMEVSQHAPKTLDQLGDLVEIKLSNGQTLDFARQQFGKTVYPWKLCSNPQGTRLWIAGKPIATPNPKLTDAQIDLIEPIEHIVYGTYKPHIEKQYCHFIHALGEEDGEKPHLAADKQGYSLIHGGNYTIEDRGIVN